ncbi:hypothetical protein Q5752_005632 [Cryptotrichosporon argae]
MPEVDIEKASGPTDDLTDEREPASAGPDVRSAPATGAPAVELPALPPLRHTTTALSTRSARQAAETLATFEKSPDNPRNWTSAQKWKITAVVSVTGFITTCGSSIGVPGIHAAMAEFGEADEEIGVLIASFYVLGLGFGPFLFAPISELYGRQVAYITSETIFILFCLGTALSQSMPALLVLRFFAGVFGSVGPSLGVATVADVFAPAERGRPVSLYATGPMAGPVLGSMLGYWLLYAGWRWLYWLILILAALNWVAFVVFTQETFAPVIQKRLTYRVSHPLPDAETWAARLSPTRWLHSLGWMRALVSRAEARDVFARAFSRPPRLLFGNPVALLFSVYYAYVYGIIYVFLVSIPLLFGSPPYARTGLFSYEWPQWSLSFAYTGMALGFAAAAATAAHVQDAIYKALTRRSKDGKGQPEFRLVMTQTGMIIMPIGLFIFGWTAHAKTHWIGPQVGEALIAYGLMLAFNSIQTYIVEAFFPYSAAATAGAIATRSVVACVLPVFAADLFADLGWGWGGSLLGLVALVAVPAPLLMFKHGRALRERYKFVD